LLAPQLVSQSWDLRRSSGEGILFGATLAWSEPPNCAPSLRSVAGLLLALALRSAYEDTLTLLTTRINDCAGVAAQRNYAISIHRAVARRAKLG